MRGLYAIVDVTTLRARAIDPIAFADAMLAAKLAALQLRAKDLSASDALTLLAALAPRCARAGVPLVANDRVDLALAANCPMVHVGQDDVPVSAVRRIAPSLAVGLSTHTPDQLARALDAKPAYVAYGPVFATHTKADACAVVGLGALREAHAEAKRAGVPLVAIGGITLDRAREVAGACDAAAVIAALVPPDGDLHEATARASAIATALGEVRS
jgi:thiamine-phosphate pyrophosphorylase